MPQWLDVVVSIFQNICVSALKASKTLCAVFVIDYKLQEYYSLVKSWKYFFLFYLPLLWMNPGNQIEQFLLKQKMSSNLNSLPLIMVFVYKCVCVCNYVILVLNVDMDEIESLKIGCLFMSLAQFYDWKAVDSSTVTYCGDFWQKSFVDSKRVIDLGWKIQK